MLWFGMGLTDKNNDHVIANGETIPYQVYNKYIFLTPLSGKIMDLNIRDFWTIIYGGYDYCHKKERWLTVFSITVCKPSKKEKHPF